MVCTKFADCKFSVIEFELVWANEN